MISLPASHRRPARRLALVVMTWPICCAPVCACGGRWSIRPDGKIQAVVSIGDMRILIRQSGRGPGGDSESPQKRTK